MRKIPPPPNSAQRGKGYPLKLLRLLLSRPDEIVPYVDIMLDLGLPYREAEEWRRSKHIIAQTKLRLNRNRWVKEFGVISVSSSNGYIFTQKKGDRVPPYGPLDAKIVIVGEAPGETEDQMGVPFCGSSGEELRKMLLEAGIKKSDCYLTNVFKTRPPDNKLDAWCVDKEQLPAGYDLPALTPRRFIAPGYAHAVHDLHAELEGLAPHLIILAGGTACWALGIGSISQSRGVITSWRGKKVLPIYHPAAIFRQWHLRVITVGDLIKAEYESSFPEIRRPERELWIEPTLQEVQEFFAHFIEPATEVSLDIENPGGTLNCISLSPSESLSLCIPFVDHRKPDKHYWTLQEEAVIWRLLRNLLIKRTIARTVRTIGQNLLYDVQHLDRQAQCRLAEISDDTMLAHHAMFPEMQKDLGFLGSVYTNELSWKDMGKELWKDK